MASTQIGGNKIWINKYGGQSLFHMKSRFSKTGDKSKHMCLNLYELKHFQKAIKYYAEPEAEVKFPPLKLKEGKAPKTFGWHPENENNRVFRVGETSEKYKHPLSEVTFSIPDFESLVEHMDWFVATMQYLELCDEENRDELVTEEELRAAKPVLDTYLKPVVYKPVVPRARSFVPEAAPKVLKDGHVSGRQATPFPAALKRQSSFLGASNAPKVLRPSFLPDAPQELLPFSQKYQLWGDWAKNNPTDEEGPEPVHKPVSLAGQTGQRPNARRNLSSAFQGLRASEFGSSALPDKRERSETPENLIIDEGSGDVCDCGRYHSGR